jgi:CO/xanthine dehydrogenase Mo-binding subunit
MNELADAAGLDPLDVRLANFAEVSPADGRPWSSNRLREAYEEGARRYGWRTRHQRPRREGPWVIGHGMATCSMGSFRFPGAGRVRLRRAVGVYSAGRIVNPVTARAQMTGGIIWGWGKATMEESDQEPVHGRWLAKNLSNVAVPVNADIPADIDVSFTDEYDETASLIGARGIGELGATGVDAAVAAAVHDAVGVRVRDLPILPWKVLAG